MKVSLKKFTDKWLEIVQDIIWAQWNRLGLMGTGGSNRCSTDIEASLLLATWTMRGDTRLLEGIYSWLKRYENIVNGERLTTLIRHQNDEKTAEVLGGLFESGQFKTLRTVVKACKKMCPSGWKAQQLPPRSKLQDPQQILKNNGGMRYRYLYGTSLRADIIYLLSVSHHCKKKREVDHLTTVRLADIHLGCNHSTVYRIQKDLEEGGILVPQHQLKNQYIVTWQIKDISIFLKQTHPEAGLIRWLTVNDLFFSLFHLIRELETISDETVARYKINQFHSKRFPDLIDHGIKVPVPYGNDLAPLKEHRSVDLAKKTTQALQAFYDLITHPISATEV